MLILRRIFQVIFWLLCLFIIFTFANSPDPDYANSIPVLIFFILIIMVLGPWWPGPENIEKSKLNLPTDNPKLAFPLFAAGMGLFCLHFAWASYSQPHHNFRRIERTIYMLLGVEGVALFWLSMGIVCFVWAYRAYKQHKVA